ncbi:olfactory receptor 24-like [Rana temporaria]|uniref:olfactory receptor 24-like n=1 Tax=Rana temporaria TaxID=8407 RepID=UPI001AAD03A2|nr:olfactory receptor 24-like [Rana temporaria]
MQQEEMEKMRNEEEYEPFAVDLSHGGAIPSFVIQSHEFLHVVSKSPVKGVFSSTRPSPVQGLLQYKVFSSTRSSPVQGFLQYKVSSGTRSSPVQDLLQYKVFSSTRSSPVQGFLQYKVFSSTRSSPVQGLLQYKIFSDLRYSQIPVFLLIYVATVVGNLLIISLVVSDSHLQTPMYFSLGNVSVLDISNSSISTSHLNFNIFTGNRLISYPTCISQVFFFTWFLSTESSILTVMSYDRYVAICHPLRYATIMSHELCVQVMFFSWFFRFVCSLLHMFLALILAFPDPSTIPGLFCELYQLIQLSYSDTFPNYLLIYVDAISIGATGFFITLLSYVYIFKTILKVKVKDGRRKVYSTCSSHLMVVFIFYGTAFFNYFHPKTKDFLVGRLLSVFYTVVTTLLNPIIYSLRNRDLKGALQKMISRLDSIP